MSASILIDDLETYVGQYGTHGAIQRLQHVVASTDNTALKVDALRLCLDLLKRTANTKGYTEAHNALRELTESSDQAIPPLDSAWIEATQKQSSILKDLYEQELQTAKSQQIKDAVRTAHAQLINHCVELGDYAAALKYASMGREMMSEPNFVSSNCLNFIRLSSLLKSHPNTVQPYLAKAQHAQLKDSTGLTAVDAATGLYHMKTGKFRDAALSFVRVRPEDLTGIVLDLICPQDVALYSVLCGLASLDRQEVQTKLLGRAGFQECLDLIPQVRDLTMDFCNCKYAACLAALEQMKPSLCLDVHLSDQVDTLLQQIRSKGIVQYFAPFMSVSLHSMATAFSSDVDSIQKEVASLIVKKELSGKIDSQKKILYMRRDNPRLTAYRNTMQFSEEFLHTTQALILRMNLLRHDFGSYSTRQKK
mmetsp:Transcript_30545/g.65801  ORF Transcript_30545/g.65801 Transcript_30545/m.65801 type:complete len:421 (-) Transcript_30545:52-1314(-)|eukprot:CAMPEP_0206482144 /NCGR_PEP_ID=MMETSP0324_2-20121206/38685_1 /ASSEMBLY_ACC=CAM_ASM_000836 /TAXON_ID=2866 /ORGANISM="Crypthecodinium cohnii, Strain Seligo" /LENGTH=420 /DNA_ID=CAMNT_0053960007 /DNA_START=96 /DNA_END=1358 /DNA_ORIENTATION=+